MVVKKSDFTAVDVIADGGFFDFVYNGENLRISKANFIAALGFIGSMAQKGAVAGTPILNIDGTTNEIRNLEDGQGFKASVSPEGGALLTHNFTTGSTGLPVLVDNADKSTLIRNLLAGSGISISVSGDSLQIVASGVPASNSAVINSISDFPDPVSGVITLEADTDYVVGAKLTTSNRFVLQDNTVLRGTDSRVSGLTLTGTGPYFTAVDADVRVSALTINCAVGSTLVDFSCSIGTCRAYLESLNIPTMYTFGTVTDLLIFQIRQCTFDAIETEGLTFVGDNTIILMDSFLVNQKIGNFINLGVSTSGAILIETFFAILATGTAFLDGAASSANINAGGLGSVLSGRFSGLGDPLSTISINDALWQFGFNDDIADTRPDGLLNLESNATNTVIAVATTPVLIAGTWTVETSSQFTGTVGGRLTYNGSKTSKLPVSLTFTGAPISGTNIDVKFHLYKNGAAIPRAIQGNIISSGSPKNTTLIWQLELDTNDYLEAFVSNDTNTTDILITGAKFRIN